METATVQPMFPHTDLLESDCKSAPSAELLESIYGSPAAAGDRQPQDNANDDCLHPPTLDHKPV